MIFSAFSLGVFFILIVLELLEARRLRKENKLLKAEITRLQKLFEQLQRSADE